MTAGNSAGINDGAAALVLMRESEADRRGLAPRLRLRAFAVSGIEPEIMGYAPALAIPKALERAGLTLEDVDLVELNEAFAAQAAAVIRDVGLDPERVNVSGGAIALGHPIGATGAILTVKLMHALERLEPAARHRDDVHRRRARHGRRLRAALERRPRQRPADALESGSGREHELVLETPADELDADRKPLRARAEREGESR